MTPILLVDDYEAWRRQVGLLLQAHPEFQVTCQATDGWEAVRKAEELKPHLVLLDIGLPKLNGIEAARRIRQLSCNSKIIFLSQESSPDAVQTALNTGACGYVYKADAGSELLPAIKAVLRGERFVSSSIERCKSGEEIQDRPRHVIVHCSDDTYLLDTFTRYVTSALNAGNAAIVLATQPHREGLLQGLEEQGVDIGRAIEEGTYIAIDVAESISAMMVNDLPDRVRFFTGISGLIGAATKAAKSKTPKVVVCGEGVAVLRAQGKSAAAIRLEQLCDELADTHEVDVLCAYPQVAV
jgi:DNA-binding NarL/FixJ family response regulator